MNNKNKGIKKLKNTQINTPHDKLFKKSMHIPNVAREFLMMHLPSNLLNKIDFNTLEVLPETFIDETLRRSQVDALFKAQCDKNDLLIYILVEHQSKSDYSMPTRRLSYKSDIWAFYLETNKSTETPELPPIIDIHFYTGSKPYNGPLCLADLAPKNKETINRCLTEPMLNIWAGDLSEKQLKTHPWAATIEFIMMNRKTNNLRAVLKKIAPNIRMFYLEGQTPFVLSLFTYIENIYTCDEPIEAFAHIAGEEISPEAEVDIMSMVERAKIEAKIEIAINMLAENAAPLFVAKVTKLPLNKIIALKNKHH